jgi:single-stranded DNA-binding protein
MSAFIILTGALFRAPEQRTAKTGKPYVTATLKVAADSSADFWSILVFSESAQAELLRLGEGDKVAVQGSFKVELYTARDGQPKISRTIFAEHVLALRQPPKERKAKTAEPAKAAHPSAPTRDRRRDFDDSIPF